jgi:hypothetical protein
MLLFMAGLLFAACFKAADSTVQTAVRIVDPLRREQ